MDWGLRYGEIREKRNYSSHVEGGVVLVSKMVMSDLELRLESS